jgi:hypothetical protein
VNKDYGRVDVRRIRRELDDAKIETSSLTLTDVKFKKNFDPTVSWFDIQRMTAATTITDDAFRLGMANYLGAKLHPATNYRACIDEVAGFDHSQVCHTCGASYRYARHQRIQQEFVASAVAHGVIITTNFYSMGAEPKGKRPDVLVFQGQLNQKPLAIDFTCNHVFHDAKGIPGTHNMENQKHLKYKDYLNGAVDVAVISISTRAQLRPEAIEAIKKVRLCSTKRGFDYEVIRRMKVAVINFEPFRKQAISMRKAAGMLIPKPKSSSVPTGSSAVVADTEQLDEDDVLNVSTFALNASDLT